MNDHGIMKIYIEKYPEFISAKIEKAGISGKRLIIVKPGEYLSIGNLDFSYTELMLAPRIIRIQSDN